MTSNFVLVCLVGAMMTLGCATERPFMWVQDVPATMGQAEGDDGRIHPRDAIVVVVKDQPTLSGEFLVRDDGGYLQPTLGNMAVQGRLPAQVAADLQVRLKDLIVNPQVGVSISKVAPIRVSVVGEVKTPGAYELTRDRGLAAALAAAGWLTDFAAKDKIFVVRAGEGTTRIRFRAQDVATAERNTARFRLRDGDVVIVE